MRAVGAVVKQAIADMIAHLSAYRNLSSHCANHKCACDFGSARDFLFKTGRLEDFFRTCGMDVQAYYVREKAKRAIRERKPLDWDRVDSLVAT